MRVAVIGKKNRSSKTMPCLQINELFVIKKKKNKEFFSRSEDKKMHMTEKNRNKNNLRQYHYFNLTCAKLDIIDTSLQCILGRSGNLLLSIHVLGINLTRFFYGLLISQLCLWNRSLNFMDHDSKGGKKKDGDLDAPWEADAVDESEERDTGHILLKENNSKNWTNKNFILIIADSGTILTLDFMHHLGTKYILGKL
ncbi:hypothetical protein ACJX0J_020850, partial [Zea mays]